MRNIFSAAVGLLWGGFILQGYLRSGVAGDGAYRAGQYTAVLFGLLLFGGGVYYAYRAFDDFRGPPRKRKRPVNAEVPSPAAKAPKRRPPEAPGSSGLPPRLPPRAGR